MANLNDIVIKIIPDIEVKQYRKQLQELADNSKSAMEKSFRNLDKTMYETMRSATNNPKIDFTGAWEGQIKSFLSRFKEVQKYMQDTGFLPKDMSSGLYQAYANVEKLYRAFVGASNEANKIYEDSKTVTEEYSKWKERVDSVNKSYTNMQVNIASLSRALDTASIVEEMKEGLGPNADIMVRNFISLKNNIAEAEEEYLKLKAEVESSQDFWSRKGRSFNPYEYSQADLRGETEEGKKLTEEQREQLEKVLALQEQLNEAEANYTNKQKGLNFYSKQREVLEQIYALSRQTTDNEGNVRSIEQLTQELTRAEEEAKKLKETLDSLRGNEPTQYQYNVTEEYQKAVQHVKDLRNELVVAASRTNEMQNAAKRTGSSLNQWRVAAFSFYRVLGSIATIGSDIVRGARRIANFYMKVWNTAKKVLSAFKGIGKAIRGTADEHAKSFKQMLKDIFRYSFGIRSLFMLFRRLRTYIKEAFTEMANQIPAVNAMLASLKSSLYALKGSLATAFEPILSAIAPALVRLIDLLAQAITYIGMFFAALTGRGFVYQAKKVAQTIGDAASNAKELNKQLQGFDELNNLTTSNGGGGGGDTPLAQFEKVDVPKWIEDLAAKVKKLWDDIMDPIRDAWAKVGDYVVAAWKRAFYSVKALLSDIIRDFIKAWQSGLGEIIATRFFEIIGDIGNIIANIADALREAWNANDNGVKIWTAILQIVEKILSGVRKITIDLVQWTHSLNLTPAMTAFREWLESLVPVVEMIMDILYDIYHDALKPILDWAFDGENSGIAVFFRILKDFNDSLNKSKIKQNLDKIWKAVGRFGVTVGKGLLIFMERMLGYLADWLNSDDFTEWCDKVAEFLDNIHPEDIADDLEQVVRIIKNIAEWAWKAIKFVIDHKDQILDFLEKASEHLDWIAGIFIGGKLALDIGRAALNIGVFAGSLANLFGAGGVAAGTKFVTEAGEVITVASTGSGVLAGSGLAAGAAVALKFIAGVGAAIAGYNAGNKGATWLAKVLGEEDDVELYQRYSGLSGFLDLCRETVATFAERTSEHYHDLEDTLEETLGNSSDAIITFTDTIEDMTKTVPAQMEVYDTVKSSIDGVTAAVDEYADRIININPITKEVSETIMPKYNEELGEFKTQQEAVNASIDSYRQSLISHKSTLEVIEEAQKKNVQRVEEARGSYERVTDAAGNVTIKITDASKAYDTAAESAKKAAEKTAPYISAQDDIIEVVPLANQEIEGTIKVYDTAGSKAEELSGHTINIKGATGEVMEVIPDFNNSLGDAQTAMADTGEAAKDAGDNIVAGIKEPMETASFGETVAKFFSNLWSSLKETFGIDSPAKEMYPIGNFILEGIVEGFKEKFDEWSKTIKEFYEGTVKPWFDPSKWTFEGVGQGLKETFEEAKELIKTPINGILGFIEKLVNGIVDGFNKMGETLGGLDIDIPDWVPEIGGKKFELKIPKLNHVTIPRLAQGAVIPPNNEFLAVLGDQKRGTNIESPLSTMVEAFNMANKGGSEQEIALLQEQNELLRQLLQKEFGISENTLYQSVRNQDNIYYNSTGRSGFAY